MANTQQPISDEQPQFRLETEQDLTENLEPPFVIVVQGSRESGKTTLIKSLVQHFTKQKIHDVRGTITLRTNKNSRITLYECPTDMQAMIDLAKICDLALILIDASIGFEMESFEFLSLLQNHGMPNVMGILTHLDYFRENKHLRKTKKKMKKRFWKEVYDGAKLFYFSGQQKDGMYPQTEVHNLGRFITVQKIKPLSWRVNHSYVVADRFDMIETQHEDDQYNMVTVYGYVRGTYLDRNQRVHVNGLGDYDIKQIQKMDDPCPIELKKTVRQKQAEHEAEKNGLVKKSAKKRSLKDKERVLYAPYTNIGCVNFEKTTGYINIPDTNVVYTRIDDEDKDGMGQTLGGVDAGNLNELNEGQKMVFNLQDAEKNSKMIDADAIEAPLLMAGMSLDMNQVENRSIAQHLSTTNADIDDDELDAEATKARLEARKRAAQSTLFREREVDNLQTLIYGEQKDEGAVETFGYSDFQDDATTQADVTSNMAVDTFRYDVNHLRLQRYQAPNYKKLLKKKFVTGQSKDKILENLINMSDSDDEGRDKAGDAIDKDQLRRIEDNDRKGTKLDKKRKRLENKGVKVDTDSDEMSEDIDDASGGEDEVKDLKAKGKKKKEEDPDHKPVKKDVATLKKGMFLGEKYGHYKIGTYVQIEIRVEKKFSRQLQPEYPVVMCSLKHQETGFAYVRVRIKKHRWYPHILKGKDPVTFSMGWRKFQSIPVYTMQGDAEDDRMRMIKYTPKFGHCYAVFYAPTCSVGTPFVGIQKLYDTDDAGTQKDVSHFRLCVTGVVVEMNTSFKVMKKLKLIGEPYKIMKNTAFIKGMFNSSLEVAKFGGASIKTVSGIRGSVKKAVKDGAPDGAFRATFEDKIQKSDVIFLRTWYAVDIPKFCNHIIAYGRTRLLKTHAELRKERGIELETRKDSEYLIHDEHVDRERDERVFAPLQVPKAITAALPFKSKEKVQVFNDATAVDKKRQTNLLEALNLPTKRPFKKMFMSEDDKKIYSMVQRLGQLEKDGTKEKKAKEKARLKEKSRVEQAVTAKREAHSRENRVNRYKKEQGGNNHGGSKRGGKKP